MAGDVQSTIQSQRTNAAQNDPMSMLGQDATMPGQGGGGATAGGNYAFFPSKGFGQMPEGASPLSQAFGGAAALGGIGSKFEPGGGVTPTGGQDIAQRSAAAANVAYQQNQQQFLYDMQAQQIQQQQAKTQTWQKLLALFGGQGQGGAGLQNPAQGFMSQLMAGGQGMQNIAANSPTLPGRLGQVDIAFNDTGGLRSQMQRLNASQNRFADASSIGASRQGILDRNFGIARSNAFGGAFGDVINPMMQAAATTTQGWMGGGLTPRLAAESLTNMAGKA